LTNKQQDATVRAVQIVSPKLQDRSVSQSDVSLKKL